MLGETQNNSLFRKYRRLMVQGLILPCKNTFGVRLLQIFANEFIRKLLVDIRKSILRKKETGVVEIYLICATIRKKINTRNIFPFISIAESFHLISVEI